MLKTPYALPTLLCYARSSSWFVKKIEPLLTRTCYFFLRFLCGCRCCRLASCLPGSSHRAAQQLPSCRAWMTVSDACWLVRAHADWLRWPQSSACKSSRHSWRIRCAAQQYMSCSLQVFYELLVDYTAAWVQAAPAIDQGTQGTQACVCKCVRPANTGGCKTACTV
jgi:hypothetical protein